MNEEVKPVSWKQAGHWERSIPYPTRIQTVESVGQEIRTKQDKRGFWRWSVYRNHVCDAIGSGVFRTEEEAYDAGFEALNFPQLRGLGAEQDMYVNALEATTQYIEKQEDMLERADRIIKWSERGIWGMWLIVIAMYLAWEGVL